MPETRTAAGYIRVSSEEQAQHGISCDAQRSILEAWATMTQAGPIRIYEDPGFSGKNTARPALQRLLADVRACQNIKKRPPEEQKPLLQKALRAIEVTPDDYRLVLAWHLCGKKRQV